MIICAPLRSADAVAELAAAGAGEFYAGIDPPVWRETFGTYVEMNRRGFCGGQANFGDFGALADAAAKAHALDRKIMLAINQHQFADSQIPPLVSILQEVKRVGIDGVILADVNLILLAADIGLKVVVSTDAVASNRHTFALLEDLGASRVVLPRAISLDEIRELRAAFPRMEIEAFMLNGPCKYTDGSCFTLHTFDHGAFCQHLNRSRFRLDTFAGAPAPEEEQARGTAQLRDYQEKFRDKACGLCACRALIDAGVGHCKLVGRVLPVERIKADLGLIDRAIRLAARSRTEEAFLQAVASPFDDDGLCRDGYQCYFPEVRRPVA